jgi:phenylalanyl-tRNA synthetase beta chain
VYVGPRERQPIDVTLSEINRLLGTTLSYDDVERILIRFDWEFSRAHDEFAITSPWERTDLTYPQAFIEEIGRVYGYANISGIMPPQCDRPTPNRTQYYTDKIRTMLTERGYSEVLTYTLRNSGNLSLVNPLASDKSHLRASLTEGLSQALSLNVNNAPLLGLDDIRLFEIGTVWSDHGEDTALALGVRAVRGKQAKLEKALLEDMASVLAMLGASSAHTLSPVEGVAEITLDPFITLAPTPGRYEEALAWHVDARFTPWSRYPFMARDIAVWVPANTSMDVVQSIVLEKATDLLVRCDTFDTFTKEGRTSYAWHLVFQSKERTLTDEEVGGIMSAITNALNACKDWEVR